MTVGTAVQGEKYTRTYRTSAEIARLVRADIKAAVADGTLPGKPEGFKYSVRSATFSGGQSVSINVIGPGDSDWAFRDVTDDDWQAHQYGVTQVFTDEAKRIGDLLRSTGKAYTREDIDSMTDYFDVSCWINVYAGSGGACL